MKIWKQIVWSLVLAGGAFLGWAWFYPGAGDTLARYGIDWFSVSSTGQQAGDARSGGGAPRRGGFSREALVVVAPVGQGVVNDRLTAIGTGQAVRTVSMRPLVAGQIAEIPVTSGARVDAGDVIIRLDSAEEELSVERARLAAMDAEQKATRLGSLAEQRAISSVEADAARTELQTARVALREAELALSRRTVTAPISGSLGILSVNVGDYITNQTDITTIDDRSEILVEFHVPERFAAAMTVGKPIEATAIARPGETFEGSVTAVDNRVDESSRTLRVRALVPNQSDHLRAGMSFEVEIQFQGETYPTIDPLAVQWDSTGPYVWRVVDGKAERVEVAIIQRNADRVLVEAEIAEGDEVVTEGVQSVRQGAAVRIAGAEPNAEQQGGGGERPGSGGAGS